MIINGKETKEVNHGWSKHDSGGNGDRHFPSQRQIILRSDMEAEDEKLGQTAEKKPTPSEHRVDNSIIGRGKG